jgi:lysophospholipase L1-like esterase
MKMRGLVLGWFVLGSVWMVQAAGSTGDDGRWVATWVSAQQLVEPHNLPPAPGLQDRTLRQVIQPTVGGQRLRLTFSNEFGEAPLVIGAAHVALAAGGDAIAEGSGRAVTFDGRPGVTVQPGTKMMSDDVDFPVVPFRNLAVTVYVEQMPERVTGHPGSRTTSFVAPGNVVAKQQLREVVGTDRWYLLASLDVWAEPRARAIVILGDSITDGRGSTTNQNDRWPNVLARRLHESGATHLAVLNQGAGGGRVLREGLGLAALARFDRDVIAVPGVESLVLFIGVNDIGTAVGARAKGEEGATADDLVAAFRQMIRRAHSHGIKVVGATIMPFRGFSSYDTPEAEADRQAVNRWIRESGEFDAVIDFDAITRDPAQPNRLKSEIDGGDRLHPSAAGYQKMAEAIDLSIWTR